MIISPWCFIQVHLEVVASVTLGFGGTVTPPLALFMTLLAILILIGVKHVQAGQSAGTVLLDVFTFYAVNITSLKTLFTHLITVEASLQNKAKLSSICKTMMKSLESELPWSTWSSTYRAAHQDFRTKKVYWSLLTDVGHIVVVWTSIGCTIR